MSTFGMSGQEQEVSNEMNVKKVGRHILARMN
jgi:hypothetical protein